MPAKEPSIFRTAFSRGTQWIWLTGAALATCLLMIAGLLLVVIVNGLGVFWPHALLQADLEGRKILGLVSKIEHRPALGLAPSQNLDRWQFKIANRDLYSVDFRWVDRNQLTQLDHPQDAIVLERTEYGDFFGYLTSIKDGEGVFAEGKDAWQELQKRLPEIQRQAQRAKHLQRHQIGDVNQAIQEANLAIKKLERRLPPGPERQRAILAQQQTVTNLNITFNTLRQQAIDLDTQSRRVAVTVKSVDGREKQIAAADIVRAFRPNDMSFSAKVGHYLSKVWEFASSEPRESNTEGGILPAIFGTVFMTLLMSIAVVPFGVLAAFYLREYAKQGPFVRVVRIAVNNLAGVPSIVFGVFGLGFFVYFLGGSIDRLFYPDLLPQPTFGTGGILWASLTLALLTVPVVIVATEESIAAVPRGAKEGSLALGATKFQTVCRVVLPASLPGILTGLILAVARGAGEVAPLMITGVVKLAPSLPVDGQFPYLHLERKFMHLGFHIYDVGFQSPNVEAAKPMVFTTALLLLVVVAALNLVAIFLREKIRRKFRTGAF